MSDTRSNAHDPFLFVAYQRMPDPGLPTPVAGLYVSANSRWRELFAPASAMRLLGPQVLSHGAAIDSTCCHPLAVRAKWRTTVW